MVIRLVRRYSRGQTNQGEVLDDYSYMTFALVAFTPKVILLQYF